MAKDRYSALYLSHSSITDFLLCPRAYYLKNVYKDPKSNRKIQIVGPHLSLGSAVHDVLESLSTIPTKQRFNDALIPKFEKAWEKYSGEIGGFSDKNTEHRYKERGITMIKNVQDNPGPLVNLAVKINMDLPMYWLSEDDNIILCGKIDWLEYLEDSNSVHIIDFKTTQKEERKDSLQLPIYSLLVSKTQTRPVSKASYWYLELPNQLVEKPLPDTTQAEEQLLKIGRQILLAKKLNKLACPKGGCRICQPFEDVLAGKAKYVGTDSRKDLYILPEKDLDESIIL